MVSWIQRFFSLCVRIGRTFVAGVECEIRVVRRDAMGVSRVVHSSPPVRPTDSRPRIRVVLTWREGPPEGLMHILARLEARNREVARLRRVFVAPGVIIEAPVAAVSAVIEEPLVALEVRGTHAGR